MRLRKNLVQGIEALALAMLCYWTNADGAAVILFIISITIIIITNPTSRPLSPFKSS